MSRIGYILLLPAIYCLFASVNCFAQDRKIDSIENVLKSEGEDTLKTGSLNDLSEKFWRKSAYDSALKYAGMALDLSKKLEYTRGAARAYTNMGNCNYFRGNYVEAVSYYNEAYTRFKLIGSKKGMVGCLNNIGVINMNQGEYPKALEVYFKVLELSTELKYKQAELASYGNIGLIYYYQKDDEKAVDNIKKAIDMAREIKDSASLANNLMNIADVFQAMTKYDSALACFKNALYIDQKVGDMYNAACNFQNIGLIYNIRKNYEDAVAFVDKSLIIGRQMKNKEVIGASQMAMADILKNQHKADAASLYYDSALVIFQADGDIERIRNIYAGKSTSDSIKGDYVKAWAEYMDYVAYSDSILNAATIKKTTKAEMNYEFGRKTDSAKAMQAIADAVAAKEKQREKVVRNGFVGGFSIMFLAAIVFFFQRRRIAKEKERSEELLLNILPSEVAEELKVKGSADAKAFDDVTVIFTDFKGFTSIAEKLSAKELVAEIDYCFKGFDNIIHKYNIEKIKTIGDSYMAVGGLPVANKTHAKDVVNAAMEIVQFMEAHKQQRIKENKPVFEIRIGINSGHVVAGIVGVKKFAYDIWGDTVNLASRMESSGEPGKINISGSTYELVKNDFTCIHRGKIQAKNKGEVDMYFVN